jgi:hypothetical protein
MTIITKEEEKEEKQVHPMTKFMYALKSKESKGNTIVGSRCFLTI